MFKKIVPVALLLTLLFSVGCNNSVSATHSSTLTPVSLDDVTVSGVTYDGCNYVQWLPVKNATEYRLYRYSDNTAQLLKSISYKDVGGETYEYFDIVNHENILKDGKTYKYIVVANGVQANRGASSETSKTEVEFLMDENTILGDSQGSVELVAKIPEMYSQVPVPSKDDVSAVYDPKLGAIRFNYTLPEFFEAYAFAGNVLGSIKIAHDASVITADDFDYFAESFTATCPYGGAKTFSYPGKYTYKLTLSWISDPNYTCDNYYLDNSIEGSFEVPASAEKVPAITVTPASTKLGMKITFTDTLGASYKLWKADPNDYVFTEVTAVPETETTFTSGNKSVDYTYYDSNVEYGKTYVYALTGTYNEAAMLYQEDCVKTVKYTSALSFTPQFAAINNDGIVSLSWNAEDGISYSVIRSENYTDATKGTYKEVNVDLSDAVTVNGVTYVTDTIEKLAESGSYKYTLIGVGAGISGSYATATDTVTYNIVDLTITNITTTGADTNNNGAFDKIKVTVVTDDGFDMTGAKFFRAKVQADNVSTSVGAYEFTSAYSEVELSASLEETADNTYVYYDNTLSEEDIAMNVYAYAVVNNAHSKSTIFTDSLIANTTETIPSVTVAQISASTAKYSISWNAQYKTNANPANPITIAPRAMKISVYKCYSDANAVDNVTEWGTPFVVTDNSSAFIDSTFYDTFELQGSTTNTTNEYYWVKVVFENAKGPHVWSKQVVNPAYIEPKTSKITSIAKALVYESTTSSKTCMVMSTSDTGTINPDNYDVWLTPVTATGIIYAAPEKVAGLKQVTSVRTDPTDATTEKNGTIDPLNKKFYLWGEIWESDAQVTQVLVHIYDKASGEVARSLLAKW